MREGLRVQLGDYSKTDHNQSMEGSRRACSEEVQNKAKAKWQGGGDMKPPSKKGKEETPRNTDEIRDYSKMRKNLKMEN